MVNATMPCRLCCAVIMVLILVLSAEYENVRKYYPFFGKCHS
jgi:hypothetical protein